MKKIELIKQLTQIVGKQNIYLDEPMSKHTTFKIGGPADIFVQPFGQRSVIQIITLLSETNAPYFILGKGSNLVIGDKGIRGVVISTDRMKGCIRKLNKLTAGCGMTLSELCDYAMRHELSGLEFACGIPGSVGGAVYMNAGAYEGEISKVLLNSRVIDINVNIAKPINRAAHNFSYRHSVLQDNQYIHLNSTFQLKPEKKENILVKMNELTKEREAKQPLEMPSAGSVFRRPEGCYTGKLIQECGLKGYRIGGAEVSLKHCGFIVNTGNATAKDIKALIEHIQKTVMDKYGVALQTEIKFIGEE